MLNFPLLLLSYQGATFHFVLMGVKMCFPDFPNHSRFYSVKFYFFPEKVLAVINSF